MFSGYVGTLPESTLELNSSQLQRQERWTNAATNVVDVDMFTIRRSCQRHRHRQRHRQRQRQRRIVNRALDRLFYALHNISRNFSHASMVVCSDGRNAWRDGGLEGLQLLWRQSLCFSVLRDVRTPPEKDGRTGPRL